LWLPVDDLALEGTDQTIGGQDDRTIWHHKHVVLLYTLYVVPC
jgi:hypothetical protein